MKIPERYRRTASRHNENTLKLMILLNRLDLPKGKLHIKMEGLRQAYRQIETMKLIVIERE